MDSENVSLSANIIAKIFTGFRMNIKDVAELSRKGNNIAHVTNFSKLISCWVVIGIAREETGDQIVRNRNETRLATVGDTTDQ